MRFTGCHDFRHCLSRRVDWRINATASFRNQKPLLQQVVNRSLLLQTFSHTTTPPTTAVLSVDTTHSLTSFKNAPIARRCQDWSSLVWKPRSDQRLLPISAHFFPLSAFFLLLPPSTTAPTDRLASRLPLLSSLSLCLYLYETDIPLHLLSTRKDLFLTRKAPSQPTACLDT